MTNIACRRTGATIGATAAVMSVVCLLFVPYAHPWLSLAWAALAGTAAVWVGQCSTRPTPRMSEVIGAVEAESPLVQSRPERQVVSTRAIS
jgi:hypothetical protein